MEAIRRMLGCLAAAVTAAVVPMLARQPRERLLRAVASLIRPVRTAAVEPDARPALAPGFRGVRLDGETPDGRAIHIELSVAELYGGVLLGGKPGDPRWVIADERVSARHVALHLDGAVLYVRDEGSSNGSSLNARVLQPRRDEVVAHGDWLSLGGIVLKLTLY